MVKIIIEYCDEENNSHFSLDFKTMLTNRRGSRKNVDRFTAKRAPEAQASRGNFFQF